jgi:PAS domain-containing protein
MAGAWGALRRGKVSVGDYAIVMNPVPDEVERTFEPHRQGRCSRICSPASGAGCAEKIECPFPESRTKMPGLESRTGSLTWTQAENQHARDRNRPDSGVVRLSAALPVPRIWLWLMADIKRIRRFIQSSPHPAWWASTQGHCGYASPALERLTGFNSDQVNSDQVNDVKSGRGQVW